jgi:hypothetical protein
MARIRTIKPSFFRHEALYELERSCSMPIRIAFAGLWTAADREGRFVWHPRSLKLDCLPYDDLNFSDVMDKLQEGGFIEKYEVNGRFYGFIPTWCIHQHINKRESQSTIPDPSSARTCNTIPARGEGKGKGREGKGTYIDEIFEKFWSGFPKDSMASKTKAFGIWQELSEDSKTKAVNVLPNVNKFYLDNPERLKISPANFLVEGRFEGFINGNGISFEEYEEDLAEQKKRLSEKFVNIEEEHHG